MLVPSRTRKRSVDGIGELSRRWPIKRGRGRTGIPLWLGDARVSALGLIGRVLVPEGREGDRCDTRGPCLRRTAWCSGLGRQTEDRQDAARRAIFPGVGGADRNVRSSSSRLGGDAGCGLWKCASSGSRCGRVWTARYRDHPGVPTTVRRGIERRKSGAAEHWIGCLRHTPRACLSPTSSHG